MKGLSFNERQNHWYAANRYLYHLSDDELFERFRHVMEAWLILDNQGRISFGATKKDERNLKLIIMGMHAHTEIMIRGIAEPKNMFAEASIPKARRADSVKLERIQTLASQYEGCLFKFGQRKHLNRLSLKISLASTFNDASLRPAQRDDELSRKYWPNPSLGFSPFQRGGFEQTIMDRYRIDSDFDYYVLCLSTECSLRMFDDFNSDAVLVIKDKKVLTKALTKRMKEVVALSNCLKAPISYYDDVRDIPQNSVPPELTKHFKFFYQKEYRIAFLPKRTESELDEHLFFELPELESCTELITLC